MKFPVDVQSQLNSEIFASGLKCIQSKILLDGFRNLQNCRIGEFANFAKCYKRSRNGSQKIHQADFFSCRASKWLDLTIWSFPCRVVELPNLQNSQWVQKIHQADFFSCRASKWLDLTIWSFPCRVVELSNLQNLQRVSKNSLG